MVQQLGGRPTPAVGFAMGVERLILLLETLDLIPESVRQPFDLYIAAEHKGLQSKIVLLADRLRDAIPNIRVRIHCGGLKNVRQKAQQTGAPLVMLMKENDNQQLLSTIWHNDEPEFDIAENDLIKTMKLRWQSLSSVN